MKPTIVRPPRFALEPGAITGRSAHIGGAELHHMRDVMRLGPGGAVRLLAGDGAEFCGRIARFESDHAVIEITGRLEREARRPTIILAAAIIKGPRMDFMVEKAAELGASSFWPLECGRAVVRNPGHERVARWRRLAMAATKQSLAPHPMEIRPPVTVAEAAREVPKETLAVFCTEGAEPMTTIVRRMRPRAALIACGPEGDFDAAEYAVMHAAGFVAAGLGPNRLRSETAALAALSLVAGALDEIDKGI
jgi:16S rRNA (uracil1498-N3)-methyltransferase